MGTHPIFESDFDCLTECSVVHRSRSRGACLPPHQSLLSDTSTLKVLTRTSKLRWSVCRTLPSSQRSSEVLVWALASSSLSLLPSTIPSKRDLFLPDSEVNMLSEDTLPVRNDASLASSAKLPAQLSLSPLRPKSEQMDREERLDTILT